MSTPDENIEDTAFSNLEDHTLRGKDFSENWSTPRVISTGYMKLAEPIGWGDFIRVWGRIKGDVGFWPAIWLIAEPNRHMPWDPGSPYCEFDIMEQFIHNESNKDSMTVTMWGGTSASRRRVISSVKTKRFADHFMLVLDLSEKGSPKCYLNSQLIFSGSQWEIPEDHDLKLILSAAVGSWTTPEAIQRKLPYYMCIERVEILKSSKVSDDESTGVQL